MRSLKIFAGPTICRRATSSKKGITITDSCSSGKDVSARKCSFLHPELAAAESLLSLKSILRIFFGVKLKKEAGICVSIGEKGRGLSEESLSSTMTFFFSSSTFSVAIPKE